MRHFLSLFMLPVLSFLIFNSPVRGADQPGPDAAAPARHVRQTAAQHFAAANAAHDGHLTPEEAKKDYLEVSKHFDDIDVEHKGYVTEDEIRTWKAMRKAARRLGKEPVDKLRPRSAVQRVYPDFRAPKVAARPKVSA